MQSFRFIHASDFHLETPPHGLAEAPDALREILLEAPYRAANNVFDAALRHEVDFVILSGDIVAPNSAGPRALVFLRDQFSRLAECGIQVYWAGGEADQLAAWPQSFKWPSHVHFFPEKHVGRFEHLRHELGICELVGQCRPAHGSLCFEHFTASDPNRFSIAVAHGDASGTDITASGVRYWALGGEHEPTLPVETSPLVHFPGTPQGRSPAEQGPHSCTLVSVDVNGKFELHRWSPTSCVFARDHSAAGPSDHRRHRKRSPQATGRPRHRRPSTSPGSPRSESSVMM